MKKIKPRTRTGKNVSKSKLLRQKIKQAVTVNVLPAKQTKPRRPRAGVSTSQSELLKMALLLNRPLPNHNVLNQERDDLREYKTQFNNLLTNQANLQMQLRMLERKPADLQLTEQKDQITQTLEQNQKLIDDTKNLVDEQKQTVKNLTDLESSLIMEPKPKISLEGEGSGLTEEERKNVPTMQLQPPKEKPKRTRKPKVPPPPPEDQPKIEEFLRPVDL